MKILLDENVSHSVIVPLRQQGHEVESVNTLRKKGLDNGTLYREVAQSFDLCLTRDAEFVESVKKEKQVSLCKVLRIALPQQPKKEFKESFLATFLSTDWKRYSNGDDWP